MTLFPWARKKIKKHGNTHNTNMRYIRKHSHKKVSVQRKLWHTQYNLLIECMNFSECLQEEGEEECPSVKCIQVYKCENM